MITRETDYALRTLVELASAQHDGESMRTSALADALGIPYRFLRRILHKLTREGYIETQRGRGGGVRLRVAPGTVSVFDVVSTLDRRSLALNQCLLPGGDCERMPDCPIHVRLGEVQKQMHCELQRTTLEELAADGEPSLKPLSTTG